ncbi:MAG TPA: DUF6049 family protein [Actinophytocola sp.]|uniref:DUF6049 family protein n=1 Tax=Actinophytocola sp. TaxID=1872138 RepID=UPI002DB89B0D|nr:DUF6049 family protein [Actinophytocola sp.]HEU5473113.1 DUF6049 family protein [Actinophytocola sp.]
MTVVMLLAAVLLALAAPFGAAAQPTPTVPESPSRMRLDVASLVPRVITADTPVVTVTGRVTNTGDRRIDRVQVRLQRGEVLTTDTDLREAHNRKDDPVAAQSTFIPVADRLEPGASAEVAVTVPVRGADSSLRIDEPGVYPLLVNVNGQPEYSGRARLAAESVLLPALSVPGTGATATAGTPTGVTLLWPLIDDNPRVVQGPDGRPVLTDDDLAGSLAPGGRLHGLLTAIAGAGPQLLSATCLAVDPDLLETVQLMAVGYQVRTGDGRVAAGTGAPAAAAWLASLRALAREHCVIAVPYADADLVALSRAGAADLEKLALSSASVVSEALKPAAPLPGVLWPAGGTLDERTLADITGVGPTTVLTDPANLRGRQGAQPYAVGESAAVRALPIDPTVSELLGGDSGDPADQRRPLSVQGAVAAVALRTALTEPGRPMLIAPPRRWAAPSDELQVFLATLRDVFTAGFAQPVPLAQAVAAEPKGNAAGISYGSDERAAEIASTATAEVVRINAAQRDLRDAMSIDDTAQVDPQVLIAPLHYGLLRAASTAWRGRPGAAERATAEVAAQLGALSRQVTVNNPGRPLTLASGNSPIPVLLSNTMPVAITVRIKLGDTPGVRPEPLTDVLIPAHGAVNRYLPAEVIRSGRFTVDVSLSTPGGTPLGSTARLELTSTAYGKITLIITITAAAALFLLVGLRTFRRVRASRRTGAGEDLPAAGGAG